MNIFSKKLMFFALVSLTISCASKSKKLLPDANPRTGEVSVVQVGTTEHETFINVLRGKHAQLTYSVDFAGEQSGEIQVYKTISNENTQLWAVDKLHLRHLKPDTLYSLHIYDNRFKRTVERRQFSTFNLDRRNIQFVAASCMSDHHRFQHIKNKIWSMISKLQPDFILLLGDNVYVDDLDLVNPKKISPRDIWLRYIHSFKNTPLYHKKNLIPVMATWDDHDYGANNSDKNFHGKLTSKEAFQALYGFPNIKGHFEFYKNDISNEFIGFGHRFMFLDNRTYREGSTSKSSYGLWGKGLHKWSIDRIRQTSLPTWIVSGGQFFSPAFLLKDGKKVNESFLTDFPRNFEIFMSDLRSTSSPIAFLSGDVHFSEILKIESDFIGYETYEITSSPLHAFIFRANSEQDELFENKRRITATKNYNFVFIESFFQPNGTWEIKAKSLGPNMKNSSFFEHSMEVKK